MGVAKQLLAVGGRSMLAAVLEPLAAADVEGIALVTHSGIAAKIDVARFPNVFIALNEDETSEMIDSVRIGLSAWHQRTAIADEDGFLVCPADHPGIATSDFAACIAAFQAAPEKVVIAARAGRRGHPIIFPAGLASFVESGDCDHGLNALPRTHAERVVLVECGSAGVSRDVDTSADYERLS